MEVSSKPMHAKEFSYQRAQSIEHAVELLEQEPDATVLAGGHGLIPAMKKRELTPETVVDIGQLNDLQGIRRTNRTIKIGALTTHREVLDSNILASSVPVIPQTVDHITGGRQVHNFATIGGNIARAHPGYDYEGALLAAGCDVHVQGSEGSRVIPISEFVCGACSTVLRDADVVTAIELPTVDGTRVGGYAKRKEPASGNAIVGVASDLHFDGTELDRCQSATIAVNGLQESATRLTAVEEVLIGRRIDEDVIEEAADVAGKSVDADAVLDNKKASADYRCALLDTYVYKSLSSSINA